MKIFRSSAERVSIREIYTRVKCRGQSVNEKTSTFAPSPMATASITLRLSRALVPGICPPVTPNVLNYDFVKYVTISMCIPLFLLKPLKGNLQKFIFIEHLLHGWHCGGRLSDQEKVIQQLSTEYLCWHSHSDAEEMKIIVNPTLYCTRGAAEAQRRWV